MPTGQAITASNPIHDSAVTSASTRTATTTRYFAIEMRTPERESWRRNSSA